ncbi:MAG TPA: (Fe-S)-binding protein [Actinocrinis sp.]|uniref:(Fe-S)-binding protein n=1 Tax=Actinocrinis sp. TaxID=1920516 RepID=UPI002DDD2AAD|nr:(Fe-S)-binding protein [Actinocrinis sp.]HEV2346295.1 (Fe-S)-binding protein [Actinocrinis sp.]
MRAALFITCLNDALFPDAGKATVGLLERLGVTVDFPMAQTCCGQMHYNTGYQRDAEPLARNFAEVFGGYEYVVAPSGSCAAMVRDIHPRIVRDVAIPKVYELSEFLIDVLEVEDVGAYFPHRVVYHPTCHSLRLLNVGDRPTRLLRAVAGLELEELPGAQECCGFGGTFSVKNPDVSAAMGADKVANAVSSAAEYLVAADNSCLMHIGGIARRSQAPIKTIHLAEVLAATRAG